MKFNEENMQVETDSYMKDEFWRDIYENASETAKKRLRVAFWASRHLDEKEDLDKYREYREQVESEMTYDDAAYLAERFPTGAGKDHYAKLRDRLELMPLRSKEKLDEACAIMLEHASDYDRRIFEKTQAELLQCHDALVRYEWLWGAVGGNGEDAEWLGDTFDHGHGVEPDEELAYYWFKRGAMSGHADCCCRLAAMYENEEGLRFDIARALFWFREALRRNSVEAKIDLGARFTTYESAAWGKMRNPELGFEMLKSAYGKGKMRAAFYIGKCYEFGAGVTRSYVHAMRYYRAAKNEDIWGADEAYERVRKLRREELAAKSAKKDDKQ